VGTAQAASAGSPTTPLPLVKRAHVGTWLSGPERMPAALPAKFASKLQAMGTRLSPNVGGGNAFITRPYMNYHPSTSIFDHCNPDYSVDGRICEYDGTVAVSSNGTDPGFSKGYAVSRGGSDYLYYDGHNGWDLALNYENVMASADGVVRIAGVDGVNPCFGNNVVIDHPNGMSTRYAHLNQIYVSVGSSVYRGQVIGQSGNSGCSTGPHLHFGVYITSSWTAIDVFGWTGAAGADPWPSDQGNLWLTGWPANPVPWAPTGVTAAAGYQSATVSWQPPAFDGGSGVSLYTVTASPGGASATVSGGATSATVTGLTTGTSYTFTVVAINNVAASPASAPSNAVVPFAVPSQPLNVTASPGNLSATVSWSPPAVVGGSPISGYTVASTTGGISVNVPASSTQVTIPKLTSTPYQFTVTASNVAGSGPASAPSNAVTPYPFAVMYTLDGFGGLHGDGASPGTTVTGYWPNWKIAQAAALLPDSSGGYVLDGFGGVHPFKVGNNPMPSNAGGAPYWGWDIARDVVLLPTATGAQPQGYVLDGFGGVHQFGGAPVARATAYWQGLDIAKRIVVLSDGSGGYVMDGYGALHPFAVGSNAMPPNITNNAYWPNWAIANDIALLPGSTASNVGGVTLEGYGGVHGFGSAGAVTGFAYWDGWNIARSIRLSPSSTAAHPQGWTLDGLGGVHAFGGAPSVPMSAYWSWDIAVDLAVN
jgi:murein DD-endopeptidase MepM/ murein hydrolase activator NlpD